MSHYVDNQHRRSKRDRVVCEDSQQALGSTTQGRDTGTRVAPGKCRTAGLSGLAVLSIKIISTLILAPREDIMYSMRLPQKKRLTFF
jgi:hypothetical protein